jgi:hypothetical protein
LVTLWLIVNVNHHHLSAQKCRATALERASFLSPFLRIPLMPSATPGDDTAGLTQQRPKLKASNARTVSPPPLRLEYWRAGPLGQVQPREPTWPGRQARRFTHAGARIMAGDQMGGNFMHTIRPPTSCLSPLSTVNPFRFPQCTKFFLKLSILLLSAVSENCF